MRSPGGLYPCLSLRHEAPQPLFPCRFSFIGHCLAGLPQASAPFSEMEALSVLFGTLGIERRSPCSALRVALSFPVFVGDGGGGGTHGASPPCFSAGAVPDELTDRPGF